MENKKGILMPETLKIILAVIGISLLVYLAVSLYGIFIKDAEIEQAEASLEIMYSKIKSVELEEENNLEFLIESPNGWWIVAWPNEDLKKPVKCEGNYCVCICPCEIKNIQGGDFLGECLETCSNKGVCNDVSTKIKTSNINEGLVENYPIFIKGAISLRILSEENEIIVKEIKK